MRVLIIIAAVHIFSLNVFQGGILAELTRCLLLVDHYNFHCEISETDLCFLDFLDMHYGQVSHVHEGNLHEELPMTASHAVSAPVLFIQQFHVEIEWMGNAGSGTKFIHHPENADVELMAFGFFHPPQVRVEIA